MSKEFRIFNVVVRAAEEGGFWSEVLDLPGCVSQGETLEELYPNTVESIEAWLDAAEEDSVSNLDNGAVADVWRIPLST